MLSIRCFAYLPVVALACQALAESPPVKTDAPQAASTPTLVADAKSKLPEKPVEIAIPETIKRETITIETTPLPAAEVQGIQTEIEKLNAEKEKLLAEVALAQAKLDAELASSKQNTERLNTQLSELKAKQDLADFQKKSDQESSLASLRSDLEKATLASNLVKAKAETDAMEIRLLENELKKKSSRLTAQMELEEKQAEARLYASNEPIYLDNPFKDGKLIMSDRRIPLNGVVSMRTADDIVSRINYFNNKDRKMPIFLVIDDSPGGSVMAGYKILKAMQGSDAPVYVVVKSFAASMAACITTLAEKSFAYPNAVILHHQIASFSGGNLTQQQEWVREMEEWWKRLAGPVADKMGITREEFIKRMYERSSSGDWNEFADRAKELKWVDEVINEIQETGTLRMPGNGSSDSAPRRIDASTAASSAFIESSESVDAKGRPVMNLPRLNPFDCYWIYNPDGYYKMP